MSGSVSRFLHIASLALEAYSLLDSAYLRLNAAAAPVEKGVPPASGEQAEFKNIKQFRQIRQDSKGSMKAISSRLKQVNEDLAKRYKGKLRLESLQPLKQHSEVRPLLALPMSGRC
jgi:hypothetical protein